MRTRESQRRARSGFTLVELVAAMAITAVLLGGLVSAVLISSQALPEPNDPASRVAAARSAAAWMSEDSTLATSISTDTTTTIEFVVPDRGHDPDGPETIRYAWSGTAGDPLLRRYNGGEDVVVCGDVHDLALNYTVTARRTTAVPRVLLVVSNTGTPLAEEQNRIAALQRSGFVVELISEKASASSFTAAATTSDVAYVCSTVSTLSVPGNVLGAGLPVVNEHIDFLDDFGLAAPGGHHGHDHIEILDLTHEITSVFSPGTVYVSWSSQGLLVAMDGLAAGATALATTNGDPSLLVVDVGDELWGKGTATVRTVCLPWAEKDDFKFAELTPDGTTILRRAIVWAAAPMEVSSVDVSVQVGPDASGRARAHVRLLNRPEAA